MKHSAFRLPRAFSMLLAAVFIVTGAVLVVLDVIYLGAVYLVGGITALAWNEVILVRREVRELRNIIIAAVKRDAP